MRTPHAHPPDTRNRRLGDLFKKVLAGSRKIDSVTAARQFLEAVSSHPNATVCIESLVASAAGCTALRTALCAEAAASPAVLSVLQYLATAAPSVGVVANGAVLRQLLVALASPPTLWRALVERVTDQPQSDLLVPFAWFAYALLCLPASTGVDVAGDVRALLEKGPLLDEAAPAAARQTAYQMQQLLRLKETNVGMSSTTMTSPGAMPGGRHDNDFADFRDISIYPTADEMLSPQRPFLRRAAEVFGAPRDQRAGLFLDNQFRLLRESMLASLRESVQVATGSRTTRRPPLVLGRLRLEGMRPEMAQMTTPKPGKPTKCSVVVSCGTGLEAIAKKPAKARLAYLRAHPGLLRHRALGMLVRGRRGDTAVVGFAFVARDERLLVMAKPQVCLQCTDRRSLERVLMALREAREEEEEKDESSSLRFVLVDTAVFTVEPTLARLQALVAVPMEGMLLGGSDEHRELDFVPETAMQKFIDALQAQTGDTITMPRPVGDPTSKTPLTLDPSQRDALVAGLSSRLSLIQGPPGTGKSFVGALLVQALLRLTNKRILITTYTNHALDQCLGDLLALGVRADEMVRLGAKAAPATESLRLGAQSPPATYHRSQAEYNLMDRERERMETCLYEMGGAVAALRAFRPTFPALMEFLDFSEDQGVYAEAFLVPGDDDDDEFETAGRDGRARRADYLFKQWKAGRDRRVLDAFPPKSEPAQQAWDLPRPARLTLLRTWVHALVREQAARVAQLAADHDEAVATLSSLLAERNKATLRARRVVACTTTGAALHAALLAAAAPDVVLVEEAGEILEAQVVTALGLGSESGPLQAVLIGDHKQLRPKVDSYALTAEQGGGYDLDVSLFERLALAMETTSTQAMQSTQATTTPRLVTLSRQHRMVPALSVFSREGPYPALEDAPTTHTRPPVRGLGDCVVFIDHDEVEDGEEGGGEDINAGPPTSKSNTFEARLALACVRYLRQQGYPTSSMVVLTPYLGQLRLLLDLLAHDRALAAALDGRDAAEMRRAGLDADDYVQNTEGGGSLRVSTIDNYQGEESDLVIVSLVRCNAHGSLGFLASPQRVNVLRTRARDALILLGSAATLTSRKGEATWRPYLESLAAKGHVYHGLPVKCQQHPETTAQPRTPEEFGLHCPDGGCARMCGVVMACGHVCARRCHSTVSAPGVAGDDNGGGHTCKEKVTITCARGHSRTFPCSPNHPPCKQCAAEDEALCRRAARNLALEAARRTQQAAYAARLQALDDEIAHQQRVVQVAREAAQEEATLEARERQLEKAKEDAKKEEKRMREKEKRKKDKKEKAKDDKDKKDDTKKADTPLAALFAMVGLDDVKHTFIDLQARVDLCARQGIDLGTERLGCVLLGNPGTGKTTVARLLARFLADAGVVPGTVFEETTGAALAHAGVAGCQALLDKVQDGGGGVVFIDEAYLLVKGSTAALDFLLPEVENLRGKVVFLLAGYAREMEAFFGHNPGLASRFPTTLAFQDYTDEELLAMLGAKVQEKYGGRMQVEGEGGWTGLYARIVARRVGRGRGRSGFGNARALEKALDAIYRRQARRLRRTKRENDPLLLTKEDMLGPEPQQVLASCKAWTALQAMVGLAAVKEAVRTLLVTVQQNYARELAEQPVVEYSLNKLFLGNPGTGKTTVAKLYGQILGALGLLSNGEVVVRTPADFVGAALGQSEEKTKAILAATVGKVLVIDEAYGLYGGGGGSGKDLFRTAVVDTLVADVQGVPGDDRCVLLLGYADQMEEMLQHMNPGLSRRFPLAAAFVFNNLSEEELLQVLDYKLQKQGFTVTPRARRVVAEMLGRARSRPHFGNGGEVDILLDAAKARQQGRLAATETSGTPQTSHTTTTTITTTTNTTTLDAPDFDEHFDRADTTPSVRRLFADTVGQDAVVEQLEGYQQTVRALRAHGLDAQAVRDALPFTFVFTGPPGTGKTMTAAKIAQVFYDLGVLAAADVDVCSVTDLVGQYVGQTGPKVRERLDKALGRVLFIDEAYRLAGGAFAAEAADELVDALTKPRYQRRLVVVLAGYTADMDRLLATNAGLASRFAERVDFAPLPAGLCVELLERKLKTLAAALPKATLVMDMDGDDDLRARLTSLFASLAAQPHWGSARDVGTLAQSVFNQAIRGNSNPGEVAVTASQLEGALQGMLAERRRQRANQAEGETGLDKLEKALQQMQVQTQQDTQTSVKHDTVLPTSTEAETEPKPTEPEPTEPENKQTGPTCPPPNPQRDAGVSDAVWDQLQRDRQAMEDRQREHARLREEAAALETTDDPELEARRQAIVTELLAAEARKKAEEAAQRRLAAMGCCPVGYAWIAQEGGWRCAGGSHFVTGLDGGGM